ncbi:MAG: M14 family zinc carboxypeptidase [Rhodothalassiaceae bacterium]
MLMRLTSALCLLCAAAMMPAAAEPISFYQVDGVSYDPTIPTPDDVLGFGLGERPMRHHEMVSYLRLLADRSDRIAVETIGYSHERRPILFFTVSAPGNLADIATLRQAHLARLEPGQDPGGDTPAVVWMNYGVHGAEASGMEAAVPVLYHLAAAQGEAIERSLDQAVILITAIFNPDGHARRIDHVTTYLAEVPVTDPAHIQHDLWLKARTNHYWFDLNRQWLPLTQPEARAWMAQWHKWKPQVTADFHEMGSEATYYFHPGVPARKNPLIPPQARELAQNIAGYHVQALDEQGRLYYGEEGFDNYYVGKGSTYPQVNGSVGFLFEAGTARGGLIETSNGMKRYADNIHTHFTTSLTTIEGALANKQALKTYQSGFFDEALQLAAADATKAYVWQAPGDDARSYHFLDLLNRHDITVYQLAEDVTIDGTDFDTGQAYIVPMAQPQYHMIRALFDHVTAFEETIFYDVSGWTMPAAYDLDYAPLMGRRFSHNLLGEPVTEPRFPQGRGPTQSDYGYMFDWTGYYAPRALYRLLSEDVIVRVAFEEGEVQTEAGVRPFKRGSLFVPMAGQTVAPERIHAILTRAAQQDGVDIYAVTSGRTPTPGADLGGRSSFKPVPEPRILLPIDGGIISYDAGEVWHQLDHRMHMPVVMVPVEDLSRADLWDYSHIILSGGRPALPDELAEEVRRWTRDGGTVIGVRQGALWAQQHVLGRKADDTGEEIEQTQRFAYAGLPLYNARDVIGGAIFVSDLDVTHPLGFGYTDRRLPSHKNMAEALLAPNSPVAEVARYGQDPLLSGYASTRRIEELAGTPMLVHEPMGRGAVVLFADNPNFRAMFLGTSKLFMNALFFSTLADRARPTDD